jgi:Na+-driven multidrug efflux pump
MDYGFWVLIACPFVICSMILNNALRFEGKAFYAMFGLTTGGLLNIFGDWLLVRKLNMGVYGAGLATAVSQFISFSILIFMFRKMAQSKIRFRSVSRNFRLYFSICRVGFPSLIRQSLSAITTGILNNLTKSFGDAAQTGYVEYNEAFASLFQNKSKYNAIMIALGDMLYREFNRSST